MKAKKRLLLAAAIIAAASFTASPLAVSQALVSTTLQSATVANGNGTALKVTGMGTAVLTVNCAACSGGTQINFEACQDCATPNWVSIAGILSTATTPSYAVSTTTAGVTVWTFAVSGYSGLRARISAYSAGTVTITGTGIALAMRPVQQGGTIPAGTDLVAGAASFNSATVTATGNHDQVSIGGTVSTSAASGRLSGLAIVPTQQPGGGVNGVWSIFGNPTLANSSNNVLNNDFVLANMNIANTYTGTLPNVQIFEANQFINNAAGPVPLITGFWYDFGLWSDANLGSSGTLERNGLSGWQSGTYESAPSGVTINYNGAKLPVPTGSPNGGTNNNAALRIVNNGGVGGTGTLANYGIADDSTAPSYFTGPLLLGGPGGSTAPAVAGQTGIKFVVLPNGTVGANGTFTLGTAITAAYANAFCSTPSGAVNTGVPAAQTWYFCQFSSTTAGTLFNNIYTAPGTPQIPVSPTAFSGTTGVAYTQATGTDILGPGFNIPGNSIGKNGGLEAVIEASYPNNANNKTPKFKYSSGASACYASPATTTTGVRLSVEMSNDGVTNAQTCTNVAPGQFGFGSSSNGFTRIAVDSTTNQTAYAALNIAVATDFIVLERYRVMLYASSP